MSHEFEGGTGPGDQSGDQLAGQPGDQPAGQPGDGARDDRAFGDEGPPRTGDPAVDAALVAAAAVRGAEPAEQLETYVGTHRSLQDRLADSGA